METFKIKASLRLATFRDVLATKTAVKVGKRLFFKDPETGLFRYWYYLADGRSSFIEAVQLKYCEVLYELIAFSEFGEYHFELHLEPCTDYDLFSGTNIRENKCYYIRNGNSMYGPNYTNQLSSYQDLKSRLELGVLFKPSNMQPLVELKNQFIKKSA